MAWRETALARRLGLRLPIIQAPMAGGGSTPRLAAAVSAAGGLGSVAGAMLQPDDLRAAINEVRALTDAPFAVNLFAPLPPPSAGRVTEWARLTGVTPSQPPPPARFSDQLAVVIAERVPIFSFTFGIAPLADVDAVTIGTATTVAEAIELERAGVDAVVAQGFEAGGHRGTFLRPVDRSLIGTLALGARAVQMGTAFLDCPEAGTSEAHRRALPDETTVTRSNRPTTRCPGSCCPRRRCSRGRAVHWPDRCRPRPSSPLSRPRPMRPLPGSDEPGKGRVSRGSSSGWRHRCRTRSAGAYRPPSSGR